VPLALVLLDKVMPVDLVDIHLTTVVVAVAVPVPLEQLQLDKQTEPREALAVNG
jgi:hypothetical protein